MAIGAYKVTFLQLFTLSRQGGCLKNSAQSEFFEGRISVVKLHNEWRMSHSTIQALAAVLGNQEGLMLSTTATYSLAVLLTPAVLTPLDSIRSVRPREDRDIITTAVWTHSVSMVPPLGFEPRV